MESRVNYTVVGGFVLTLSLALILSFAWLTVKQSDKQYKIYLAYMNESVAGLNINAPVKYNGVNVGFVHKIQLKAKNPKQVKLHLRIESDTLITQSTKATMVTQGLTGIRYINLTPGDVREVVLRRKRGKRYPVIQTEPSLFMRLDKAVSDFILDFDRVSKSIQEVLDDQNLYALKKSLANISSVTTVLAAHTAKLSSSITNLEELASNIAKASQAFPELMSDMHRSVRRVHAMAKEMQTASHEVTLTMQQTRGALAQVNQQAMPEALQSLHEFRTSMHSMQQLLSALQDNPSILVRGQKPSPPGPGE